MYVSFFLLFLVRYPAINKPVGVLHWLQHSEDAKNVDWVVILDADQIIRGPIIPWELGAERGRPFAAHYGYFYLSSSPLPTICVWLSLTPSLFLLLSPIKTATWLAAITCLSDCTLIILSSVTKLAVFSLCTSMIFASWPLFGFPRLKMFAKTLLTGPPTLPVMFTAKVGSVRCMVTPSVLLK